MLRPADYAMFSLGFCRRHGALAVVLVWLLGCWAPLLGAEPETVPGADDKWRRYESPHFELFSHNNAEVSRRLLRNLELLRAAFFDLRHEKEKRSVEVTIYYFATMDEFRPYVSADFRKLDDLAGFYLSRPDRAVIVLPLREDGKQAQQVIFHEYVHHLTEVSGRNPALWFREGIADVFSTIEEEPDGLIVGKPIPARAFEYRAHPPMPLEALFATDSTSPYYHENDRVGLFYGESWCLVHYLLYGDSGLPRDRIDRFLTYIEQEGEKGDPVKRRALFQETMGMDYPAMIKRLNKYLSHGRFSAGRYPLPKIAPSESYAVRAVPRDEIRGQLTELDLRVNRSPAAKLALLNRLDKNPDDIRALEILGTDALIDGDEAAAQEHWEQAVRAGTRNPAILRAVVEMEDRAFFTDVDMLNFRLPEEKAQYLRMLLGRCIDAEPQQTRAYEVLAWVEATAEQPMASNVSLVQARYPALAGKSRVMLPLALIQLRLKDRAGALRLLDELKALQPPPEILQNAALILDYLKKQDVVAPEVGLP